MMKVPQGEFELARYPGYSNELCGWDGADEFLLRQLAGIGELLAVKGEILIVNDNAGALSTALAGHHPRMLSDSYLAHVATSRNLARNGLDASVVQLLASFDPLPPSIDAVIMKVPKSLALLEDQLHQIAPHIHEKTVFVAGAMTRHIHTSTLKLFTTIVGPTRTSQAERKARLIFCSPIALLNARLIHGQRLPRTETMS